MAKYNPEIHNRRSIRLKGYDYSKEGLYFITICTQNREHLFGEIVDGKMILNEYGEIVKNKWYDLINHNNYIKLDEFIIMPNHIHGIIEIEYNVGVPLVGTQTTDTQINETESKQGQAQGVAHTVCEIIGGFKSKTTCEYIKMVKNGILPPFEKRIWQRNYYENIIRNEKHYKNVSEYIKNNPQKWNDDKYHNL